MYAVARVLLALLLLGAAPVPTKAPALQREVILVYLAPIGRSQTRTYVAPECPSGPYELRRFQTRAALDAFVREKKPMVFGVLLLTTEDAGIWTAWAPCNARLGALGKS